MESLFARKAKIVLLDYQATLVTNFQESHAWRKKDYSEWIRNHERLSTHLRDLLIKDDYYVILITARSTRYMNLTMQKIHKELNWLPNEFYFNAWELQPPQCKQKILNQSIFERFKATEMIAIESNIATREMYKKNHIFATRYDSQWTEIPKIP